jgi:hypothetical protein
MPLRVLTRDEVAQPSGIPRLRGDSLTRGLVVAHTPASDVNLVTGAPMSRLDIATEASAAGLAGRSTGAGAQGINTGVTIPGLTGLTVLVVAARMSPTATSGNPSTVQSVVHTSSSGVDGNRWMLVFGNGFGPAVDKEKPRFTQESGGALSNQQLWIDGRLQSAANPADESLINGRFYTVLASADGAQGGTPIFLHGRVFTADFCGDIRIALALVWQRNLSDAEKRSVSANPWQVFEPSRRFMSFPLVGNLLVAESGVDAGVLLGRVAVSGAVGVGEAGSDTSAAAGRVIVAGSAAATEAGVDGAVLSGQILVRGSAAATEAGVDEAVLSGRILVRGALSANEQTGADVATALGLILVRGLLDATDVGSDTAILLARAPEVPGARRRRVTASAPGRRPANLSTGRRPAHLA